MGVIDLLLLLALAIAAIVGWMTGLVTSLFCLAGLAIGVVLASTFAVSLAGKLTFLSSPAVTKLVAFFAILVAVVVLAGIFASLLRGVLSLLGLQWVDRLGGVLFGIAGGVVFWGALLALLVRLSFPQSGAWASKSPLAAFLLAAYRWFFGN